jgi:hypothetical protein
MGFNSGLKGLMATSAHAHTDAHARTRNKSTVTCYVTQWCVLPPTVATVATMRSVFTVELHVTVNNHWQSWRPLSYWLVSGN